MPRCCPQRGMGGLSCRQVEIFAASQADDVMLGKRYGKILTPRYIPPFRIGKDQMRCCFTSSTLQQATTAIRAPDAEHLDRKNHAACDKKPNNAQHQFDVVVAADGENCRLGIEWKDGKNAKHGEHRKANRRSQHTTSYLQPRGWLKCLVHLPLTFCGRLLPRGNGRPAAPPPAPAGQGRRRRRQTCNPARCTGAPESRRR